MDPADFAPVSPGRLVPTVLQEYRDGPLKVPTPVKTFAYHPDPLPPALDWRDVRDRNFDLYVGTAQVVSRIDGRHNLGGTIAGLLRTLLL